MAEKIILKAKPRDEKDQANFLRQQGYLPANVYGHGEKNQNLTVKYLEFQKIYQAAGSSSLINLLINNEQPINVLIQEVQKHPVTDKLLHVDFHKVKMTEKIHTDIALVYLGEAPAVKDFGGTLVKNYDKIEVECLPGDLIPEIKIDLTILKNLHDAIHVKDLQLPSGIVPLVDAEEVLVAVQPTKVEEEPKAEEAAAEVPAGEQPPVEGEETAQTEEKTKAKEQK